MIISANILHQVRYQIYVLKLLTDLKKQLEEEGVISISDPACGAGSTLLSTVKLCLESKIQVQD
ncbi:hypothetical protein ACRCLA_19770, partial [Acinetobacter baumannii]